MTDVIIQKVDETWIKILTDKSIELDIQEHFSFKSNNEYDPRIAKGQWDGVIRLYNRQTKKLYFGLLLELLQYLTTMNFSYDIDSALLPSNDQLDDEDIDELINFIDPHCNGSKIVPYDYQRDAFKYMMNMSRTVCLAATSAGKSLIIYLALRAYLLMPEFKGKHIFISVPSIALVEQLFSDFDDYSNKPNRDWNPVHYIQKVSGKYTKEITKPVVITTWQSMQNLPLWIYEDIGGIFVDEAHSASASVLGNIIKNCTKSIFRHGLTGSLNNFEADVLVIQGLLGPKKKFVTAKELIDQNRASKLLIHASIIEYPEEKCQELHTIKHDIKEKYKNNPYKKKQIGMMSWNAELDFLNEMEERRKLICDFVHTVKGNSIILFDRVENFGIPLYGMYKAIYPDETCFLIVGDVSGDAREKIRNCLEQYDNAKIFASFGTMKQGVSIKKLHNAFLLTSGKAKIKIIQTLGRLMRLHKTKQHALVFDMIDDLTYQKSPNISLNHAKDRIKLYHTEQHSIEFTNYKI